MPEGGENAAAKSATPRCSDSRGGAVDRSECMNSSNQSGTGTQDSRLHLWGGTQNKNRVGGVEPSWIRPHIIKNRRTMHDGGRPKPRSRRVVVASLLVFAKELEKAGRISKASKDLLKGMYVCLGQLCRM